MGDYLHRLSPGAMLIGYVDVAKSVGTQKGAIRFVSEAAITPLSHRQSLI